MKERRTNRTARRREGGSRGGAAALAFLAWIGLSLDLANPGKQQIVLNLLASLHGFDMLRLLLLPGLYFLFRKAAEARPDGRRRIRAVPACFFALNMVLGSAFERERSWDMLRGFGNGQALKAAAVFLGWSAVFYALLTLLSAALDRAGTEPGRKTAAPGSHRKGFRPLERYARVLREHPFTVSFLTLLLFYIPRFAAAYPAMFMGDTWSMVAQGYSELGMTGVSYLSPDRILRSGVYINQHHPAVYTLLLHLFLRVGQVLFGSLNPGIFLFCLLQAAVITASLAYAVSALSARGAGPRTLIPLILYAALHPHIRDFLFLVTKDGLYTASFVTLGSALFILRAGKGRGRDRVLLCAAAAGMILLRNEGKFIVPLAGLLTAWADRKNRKAILAFTAAAAVFCLAVFRGLFPALGYTKGGTQEILSVPLQQTGRVVRDHSAELSAGEREAIDRVLVYDRLAEEYNPETSDQVKDLFRQESTGAELADYLRVWAGLVLKYPDTCLQATYGNYYQYLYPGKTRLDYYTFGWSAWMCECANEQLEGLGDSFSLPEWNRRLRFISDSLVDAGLFNLPPFSILMTPALYNWTLIWMLFRVLEKKRSRKRPDMLALLIPALLVFLVLFMGPMNAYYSRYMLPLTAFLPFLACMLRTLVEEPGADPGGSGRRGKETAGQAVIFGGE